jgi:hypothetical protein
MTEIDMSAPTVRPVKGGLYGDRRGRAHGPMPLRICDRYPFGFDSTVFVWTQDGFYNWSRNSWPHFHDLITVISEPDAPTEAPAPDGVTVTTRVTQIEICAPETETIPAVTYWLGINDDGVLSVTDGCGCGVTMSPAAARAIGAELIRMGGE